VTKKKERKVALILKTHYPSYRSADTVERKKIPKREKKKKKKGGGVFPPPPIPGGDLRERKKRRRKKRRRRKKKSAGPSRLAGPSCSAGSDDPVGKGPEEKKKGERGGKGGHIVCSSFFSEKNRCLSPIMVRPEEEKKRESREKSIISRRVRDEGDQGKKENVSLSRPTPEGKKKIMKKKRGDG